LFGLFGVTEGQYHRSTKKRSRSDEDDPAQRKSQEQGGHPEVDCCLFVVKEVTPVLRKEKDCSESNGKESLPELTKEVEFRKEGFGEHHGRVLV
jgi:hypothetical protein